MASPPATSTATRARPPAPLLEVTALRGSTHLTVHTASATGAIKFDGTVQQGEHRARFAARALWVSLSTPENVADPRARDARARARPAAPRDHRHADGLASGVGRPRAAIVASGSRARPRRSQRPERAIPRSLARLARDHARVDHDRRRRPRRARGARSPRASASTCCVVSGGLGPTHDDRTVELIARAAGAGAPPGRRARRAEIESCRAASRPGSAARMRTSRRACSSRRRSRTARSSSGSRGRRRRSCSRRGEVRSRPCCPGRPRELQALWPDVLATEPVRRVLARARASRAARPALLRRVRVARRAGARRGGRRRRRRRGDDLRPRLRDPRRPAGGAGRGGRAAELEEALAGGLERYLFSRDRATRRPRSSSTCCRARGLTLATAESCTGGLVGAG